MSKIKFGEMPFLPDDMSDPVKGTGIFNKNGKWGGCKFRLKIEEENGETDKYCELFFKGGSVKIYISEHIDTEGKYTRDSLFICKYMTDAAVARHFINSEGFKDIMAGKFGLKGSLPICD